MKTVLTMEVIGFALVLFGAILEENNQFNIKYLWDGKEYQYSPKIRSRNYAIEWIGFGIIVAGVIVEIWS